MDTQEEHEQEEHTEDPIEEVDEEVEDQAERKPRPALVINVQTWATPIVALFMLVIGLVGGYLLYPEVSTRIGGTTPVAAVPGTNPSAGAQTASTGTQPDQASREEMMEFLISETRHFKGNPDAEVAIIEFSDFQ